MDDDSFLGRFLAASEVLTILVHSSRMTVLLQEPKNSIWSLSPVSESCPHTSPVRKGDILDRDLLAHNEAQDVKSEATKDPDFLDNDGESAPTEDLKMKSPKKQSDRDSYTPKKMKKVEKTANEGKEAIYELSGRCSYPY